MTVLHKEIITFPINKLKPYKLNAKLHPQEQIDKIIKSFELAGVHSPIVVNKDCSIIAGHGRLIAAKQMNLKEVPCIVLDVAKDVADKARLMDNKSAESEYDIENLLKELTRFQGEIEDTGYTTDDLDSLLVELEESSINTESNEGTWSDEESDIPEDNKDINEEELSETKHECPNCGFKW